MMPQIPLINNAAVVYSHYWYKRWIIFLSAP